MTSLSAFFASFRAVCIHAAVVSILVGNNGRVEQLPFVSAKITVMLVQNFGLLVDTRLDPLVNPGTCASHVHSVYGNANFGKKVKKKQFKNKNWFKHDEASLAKRYNKTTSELTPNLSSYWVASMYIKDPINQMYFLVPSYARAYYSVEHEDNDDVDGDVSRNRVNPFPTFMQIIIGVASRKTDWMRNETDRDKIKWTLTDFNRETTNYLEHGDWAYLKKMDRTVIASRDELELSLHFPDCLAIKKQGKKMKPKIKSKGFRKHAAYSSTQNEWDDVRGWCPESHPYPIPRLDLEIRYDLRHMRELLGGDVVDNPDNWILSTGDASGAGGHADFVTGWPKKLMKNMIANCTEGQNTQGRDCVLENFELDGESGKSKTVPYNKKIPNEFVYAATALPGARGECPQMVPADRFNVGKFFV